MTGKDIKRRRVRMELSQMKLANYLGVTRNTVARWERGELAIAHEKMLMIALNQLEDQHDAQRSDA